MVLNIGIEWLLVLGVLSKSYDFAVPDHCCCQEAQISDFFTFKCKVELETQVGIFVGLPALYILAGLGVIIFGLMGYVSRKNESAKDLNSKQINSIIKKHNLPIHTSQEVTFK